MKRPEEAEFELLDQLFLTKELLQLEIGWACNGWLDEQRKQSGADSSPRAALSYALDTLSERYIDTFSSVESARKNITTWMRVSKYFTREKVKNMEGDFTFHHLRKCYVGGIFPDANAEETEKNVSACMEYAREHNGKWPPVNSAVGHGECNLWDKFLGLCSRILTSDSVEDWQKNLVKEIMEGAHIC